MDDEFERDVPAEADVLGLVYDAHPALAEDTQHAIVGDRLPDHRAAAGSALHRMLSRKPAGTA
ncbi:MAG: hypothetical protein ABR576_00415 [Thermoanaerobaculia bacterium]